MGRRKPRKPHAADWNAVGVLMTLDGMTEEEELDFTWSHPELEGVSMAPTAGSRRYTRRIYEREAEN